MCKSVFKKKKYISLKYDAPKKSCNFITNNIILLGMLMNKNENLQE